ncbi:MAG: gluconate 2-dehydrogenase subunit 3 family protein [Acidimicrobiales bacterium]
MIGRYPDYDVLASMDEWDEATAKVVQARMDVGGPMTFFRPNEHPTMRRFCDIVMAQDGEPRVPVAELIDEKLGTGRLDGFQYDDMPTDQDVWRMVLAGLDGTARDRCGTGFAECDVDNAKNIVSDFAASKLSGHSWKELNVARAWSVCQRAILSAFYSHPWAWNEIGFGGPAYPQGYMRLGPLSILEPHETRGATSEDPVRQVGDTRQ